MKRPLLLASISVITATLSLAQDSSVRPVTAPAAAEVAPAPPRKISKLKLENVTFGAMLLILEKEVKDISGQPLNVVADEPVRALKLPSITLQNVSPSEALNIITQTMHLRSNLVLDDKGSDVAAYIVEHPAATQNVGNAPVPGFTYSTADAPAPKVKMDQNPNTKASLESTRGKLFNAVQVDKGRALGALFANTTPAMLTRILAIASLTEYIREPQQRADKEAKIVQALNDICEERKLECSLRLYADMHLIVVHGSEETVSLVEQTVAALKENQLPAQSPNTPTAPATPGRPTAPVTPAQ